MKEDSSKEESKCPKCEGRMIKHFSSISGNAKYIQWECEQCTHRETKCVGVMK